CQQGLRRPGRGDLRGRLKRELQLGPVRLQARGPSVVWSGRVDAVAIRTSPIGFAGATDADRLRWIHGFRRLLDGVDTPIQCVVCVESGSGPDVSSMAQIALDLSQTRN